MIKYCELPNAQMNREMKTKTYLFNYPYNGGRWGLRLQAVDREDAEARIKALGWADLDGQLKAVIPVPSFKRLARFFGRNPHKQES